MIHIACNIDSHYVRHCAVMLVSLFENNRREEFCVHVIARGLSDGNREILTQLAAKYGSRVLFYEPDLRLLEGFTIRKFSKRISMATYYRCILSALLPREVDRVLYLDCDIVVMGDIRPLWDTPLDGVGVAAVEDMGCREAARYEVLKYPMEDSYFNAGVLLVNLAYWREHDVPRACVDYYHRYPERILFNDQDLLNSVLRGHKRLVDLKWNVQDAFYRLSLQQDEAWRGRLDGVLQNPVILHFTNRKPWEYDSQHPLREVYFRYQDLTPWRGQRVLNNPLMRVRRFFRLLPFYVHLRRAKYVRL
ncbi:MAG TPA: glycosyltransferase family 8 protein [Candidatus Bacteroides merdipullorum]|uniref:Glycosyltransferase family 8 protein n=1 Tax=Candidatus Bacteroides merdipullorum TaxID=2838474 RepID=A0A9D2A4L1_9BACE|nr:glycosyltransferase family 8 protein [Candidatus Bacteroides merdipullorum]